MKETYLLPDGTEMNFDNEDRAEPFKFKPELVDHYGPFKEFITNRDQEFVLNTDDIDRKTWIHYYNGLYNIILDYIETDYFQQTPIRIVFGSTKKQCHLFPVDLIINLIQWRLIIVTNDKIKPYHLFKPKAYNGGTIKKYIDKYFVDVNRKRLSNKLLNNIAADNIGLYYKFNRFYAYLCDTVNLSDDAELCMKLPKYNELIHSDFSKTPIDQVKDLGMERLHELEEIVINESRQYLGHDHYAVDSFRAGSGINKKQFREGVINIGAKPDGNGNIYNYVINNSYINGGLNNLTSLVIDSAVGRTAQIINKKFVGQCGYLARKLTLNCADIYLHPDKNYDCHTENFVKIYIANKFQLNELQHRYYRLSKHGIDKLIDINDDNLIGQTILLRSPTKCASAARGEGICYKCYGDLAYTNANLSVGTFAAEEITKVITQRMISAKHQLEVFIKHYTWSGPFDEYMKVYGNELCLVDEESEELCIGFKASTESFNNFLSNFGTDYEIYQNESATDENNSDDYDEEEDDDEESTSNVISGLLGIKEFYIYNNKTGEKQAVFCGDTLFLTDETIEAVKSKVLDNKPDVPDEGLYLMKFAEVGDKPVFYMIPQDEGLGKIKVQFTNLIDKKETMAGLTIDDLVSKYMQLVEESKFDIGPVHFETILQGQVRSKDDILEKPDWTVENPEYEVITTRTALSQSPSITKSLEYQDIGKHFKNPMSFKKSKGTYIDLFFMERPIEFYRDRHRLAVKYFRDYEKAKTATIEDYNPLPFKKITPEEAQKIINSPNYYPYKNL